ncbi:uncharacterized protein LOC135945757 isoform X1 [Cloeon dipterum]|uniref:uncharacterized protein LOC135945757 isoform X1 n=1 Tax=Cloeon dipterum TaxID=197152 RepID=UPI0032209273
MHHYFQVVAIVVCCTVLVQGASVVRVPRVYNILIKSDGSIAPSEAVSLDSLHEEGSQSEENSKEVIGGGSKEASSKETSGEKADEPTEEPLPVLNAQQGGVVDGVNYTEVPLSRAYPLTRYTIPIIAARHPFPYLHGGLILGPVPKLAAAQREFPGESAELQQQSGEIEETKSYDLPQDAQKPIQQLPLPQYRSTADNFNLDPAAFRERLLQLQRAHREQIADGADQEDGQ